MNKPPLIVTEKICIGIHAFVGIGAIAGGSACLLDPANPLGVPASVLVNAPFTDFFIPGLLLFGLLGVGSLLAAVSFLARLKHRPLVSGFFASALVIWIVVQCVMLQFIDRLHVIFFLIGAVQGLLALYLCFKRYSIR